MINKQKKPPEITKKDVMLKTEKNPVKEKEEIKTPAQVTPVLKKPGAWLAEEKSTLLPPLIIL